MVILWATTSLTKFISAIISFVLPLTSNIRIPIDKPNSTALRNIMQLKASIQ
jgi:hypothetical protein